MVDSLLYGVALLFLVVFGGLAVWYARQNPGLGGKIFNAKQRRLGVVEAAAVDGRRRLILVRRDNVEHLIMTGGPVDVLLETGITPPRPPIIGLDPDAPAPGHGKENGVSEETPIIISGSPSL